MIYFALEITISLLIIKIVSLSVYNLLGKLSFPTTISLSCIALSKEPFEVYSTSKVLIKTIPRIVTVVTTIKQMYIT